MKQINFSYEGGFPLEQETLERLQTAYRSELFGALKAHLSIGTNQNYIVAPATNATKGWVVIQQDESNLNDSETDLATAEGILYPVNKGNNTGYLKTTRTGTNLVYGTGVSQTAYYDYEAEYISQAEFVNGVSQNSNALKINYYDLAQFKIVKDLKAIEDDINLINQTYLPLDGSKAMQGDLDLDIYKLSKLDTKEGGFATVRAADFRLGSITRKGLLNPSNSTGIALADTSDQSKTSLSINYQSDWNTTNIGGKVYLENLNTTNSTGSLLVIDDYHQVTKSNSLPELLNRITVLESKISTATAAVPIGMVAIWGKPAPFPEGWEEYKPLRGRMPLGLNPDDPDFSRLRDFAGSKTKKLEVYEMPSHSHNFVSDNNVLEDGLRFGSNESYQTGLASQKTEETGGGQPFSIMNPHTVIYFIEYTGVPSDTTAPTKPNLTISNIGTTSVTLSWTASSDNVGVTNYLVSINGNIPFAVNNVPFYNVTGLSPGTAYSFYVIAKDFAGNSAVSNTENATTGLLLAPTTPQNVSCTVEDKNQLRIQWSMSTITNGSPIQYQIFRRKSGGNFEYLDTTANLYYVNIDLLYKTTYSYYIIAIDSNNNTNKSPASFIVTETTETTECFDIESLVTMASGQSKKLKNIVVGDKLQGFSFPNEIDESDGDYMLWNGKLDQATKAEVTVVNKRTSIQPNYYEIKTADTIIRATEQHPLLVTEDGENVQWVCIKNVTQNMFLIDKTGKTKAIESIQFKEEPLDVALLDVENVDNYVISGIVAHNNKPEE